MRGAWKAFWCLSVALLTLLGALFLCPRYAARLGLDPRDLVQLPLHYQFQSSRQQLLESQDRAVLESIAAKEVLLPEVVAGRMTLAEAANRFRAMDAQNPCFRWATFRESHPGQSEAECYGHAVIDAVRAYLKDRPVEARAVSRRLEAELSQRLQASELRLPDKAAWDLP
jgi:hypothetical protein